MSGTGGGAGSGGEAGRAEGGTGGIGGGSGGEVVSDAGDGKADDGAHSLEPVCVRDGTPNAVYCDLVVQGDGLGRFEGMLATIRTGIPPAERLGSAQTRVVDGKFSITLPAVQEPSIIYKRTTVRFGVDVDGLCAPGDQVFLSSAVAFQRADGGPQQECPGFVVVNDQSSASFSTATAATCQAMGNYCQPADAGP